MLAGESLLQVKSSTYYYQELDKMMANIESTEYEVEGNTETVGESR